MEALKSLARIEEQKLAEHPFGYILEEQVGHLLRRAHQRHSAIFMDTVRPQQVTPPQWAALFKLRELGTVSQNHLGRLIAMDAATMQGLVRRLVKRGLIVSGRDPRDKRRSVLRLTPQGTSVVDETIPTAMRISKETLAPLTAEEQTTFLQLLDKIT